VAISPLSGVPSCDAAHLTDNSSHAALADARGNSAPGLNLLEELFSQTRTILTVSLQIAVLSYVIYSKGNPHAQILTYLVMLFFLVMFIMPTNSFGGAGSYSSIFVPTSTLTDFRVHFLDRQHRLPPDEQPQFHFIRQRVSGHHSQGWCWSIPKCR